MVTIPAWAFRFVPSRSCLPVDSLLQLGQITKYFRERWGRLGEEAGVDHPPCSLAPDSSKLRTHKLLTFTSLAFAKAIYGIVPFAVKFMAPNFYRSQFLVEDYRTFRVFADVQHSLYFQAR